MNLDVDKTGDGTWVWFCSCGEVSENQQEHRSKAHHHGICHRTRNDCGGSIEVKKFTDEVRKEWAKRTLGIN